MTIGVSGDYSVWTNKKQFSVSVWDANEEFISALFDTLEKRVEKALKEKDFAKVSEIARTIDELSENYAKAKEDAREQEDEYLRKQAEQEEQALY